MGWEPRRLPRGCCVHPCHGPYGRRRRCPYPCLPSMSTSYHVPASLSSGFLKNSQKFVHVRLIVRTRLIEALDAQTVLVHLGVVPAPGTPGAVTLLVVLPDFLHRSDPLLSVIAFRRWAPRKNLLSCFRALRPHSCFAPFARSGLVFPLLCMTPLNSITGPLSTFISDSFCLTGRPGHGTLSP